MTWFGLKTEGTEWWQGPVPLACATRAWTWVSTGLPAAALVMTAPPILPRLPPPPPPPLP
ncbi:unnamed protein product [Pylaiella littoralis]